MASILHRNITTDINERIDRFDSVVLDWKAWIKLMTLCRFAAPLLLLNLALISFFVAIGMAKNRGLNIQCGCFGESESTSNYLELFVRDGVLLSLGLVLVWLCRARRNPLPL